MPPVLEALGTAHALVSCVECHTPRILFETILNRLAGVVPSSDNDYQSYTRCDRCEYGLRHQCSSPRSLADFVMHVGALMEERQLLSCVLVLDHADRLRDMPASILPALMRLNQLVCSSQCALIDW